VAAPAGFDQRVQAGQPGLGVVAQAARVVIPDAAQLRALRADLQQLVDLFLVLGDGERHLGVVDREDELRGDRVLVQRHGHSAERLRRQHRRVEPRAVLADDDQVLAAPQAGVGQAAGQLAHQLLQLRPGAGLPDPVFLLAQRGGVRAAPCVLEQQARKRRLHLVSFLRHLQGVPSCL